MIFGISVLCLLLIGAEELQLIPEGFGNAPQYRNSGHIYLGAHVWILNLLVDIASMCGFCYTSATSDYI